MAHAYELSDGSLITDNGTDFTINQPEGKQYTVSNSKICNEEHTPLNASAAKEFCDSLLHAEFFIPTDKAIRSANIKQNKEGNFHLVINTGVKDNSTDVDLRQEADTITVAHNSVTSGLTQHGRTTKKHKIHALSGNTDREYVDYTSTVDIDHGERFEDEHSLSLKRNIKGRGQRLQLSREKILYEDEGFITQNSDLTSLEISSDEISKSNTVDDTKYRKKMKINFDLKRGRIQCRLKKKEYDAITIVEYKNTILTSKTGKKVKVTTFLDRDFDGQLEMSTDGSFTYAQEKTANNGAIEKFKTQSDLSKIPAEIMKEVEQIKAIAGKIAVLRNSQQHTSEINFALNPSIFDEEIKFTEVKDKDALKLADSLAHGCAEINRKLLTAAINGSDGNILFNAKDNIQRG